MGAPDVDAIVKPFKVTAHIGAIIASIIQQDGLQACPVLLLDASNIKHALLSRNAANIAQRRSWDSYKKDFVAAMMAFLAWFNPFIGNTNERQQRIYSLAEKCPFLECYLDGARFSDKGVNAVRQTDRTEAIKKVKQVSDLDAEISKQDVGVAARMYSQEADQLNMEIMDGLGISYKQALVEAEHQIVARANELKEAGRSFLALSYDTDFSALLLDRVLLANPRTGFNGPCLYLKSWSTIFDEARKGICDEKTHEGREKFLLRHMQDLAVRVLRCVTTNDYSYTEGVGRVKAVTALYDIVRALVPKDSSPVFVVDVTIKDVFTKLATMLLPIINEKRLQNQTRAANKLAEADKAMGPPANSDHTLTRVHLPLSSVNATENTSTSNATENTSTSNAPERICTSTVAETPEVPLGITIQPVLCSVCKDIYDKGLRGDLSTQEVITRWEVSHINFTYPTVVINQMPVPLHSYTLGAILANEVGYHDACQIEAHMHKNACDGIDIPMWVAGKYNISTLELYVPIPATPSMVIDNDPTYIPGAPLVGTIFKHLPDLPSTDEILRGTGLFAEKWLRCLGRPFGGSTAAQKRAQLVELVSVAERTGFISTSGIPTEAELKTIGIRNARAWQVSHENLFLSAATDNLGEKFFPEFARPQWKMLILEWQKSYNLTSAVVVQTKETRFCQPAVIYAEKRFERKTTTGTVILQRVHAFCKVARSVSRMFRDVYIVLLVMHSLVKDEVTTKSKVACVPFCIENVQCLLPEDIFLTCIDVFV